MYRGLLIALVFSISNAYAGDVYESYTSLLGFKLEKTNLHKIINKLGHTTIRHTGDAANSYYGICYVSKENNISVYFESGEMGGNEHTLLSFRVKNKVEKAHECGILKVNS